MNALFSLLAGVLLLPLTTEPAAAAVTAGAPMVTSVSGPDAGKRDAPKKTCPPGKPCPKPTKTVPQAKKPAATSAAQGKSPAASSLGSAARQALLGGKMTKGAPAKGQVKKPTGRR